MTKPQEPKDIQYGLPLMADYVVSQEFLCYLQCAALRLRKITEARIAVVGGK
jgi:hypothetical protein